MPQAIRKPASATPVSPAPAGAASLDNSLQAALVESRRRYKELVDISSDFAWETDGRSFIFVSPRGALGYEAAALVGLDLTSFLGGTAAVDDTPFVARQPLDRVEFWCRNAAGETKRMQGSAVPIHDDHGNWIGARGVARDVTEERGLEEALARAHTAERLRNHVLTAIWDKVEPGDMLAAAAAAARRVLSADLCLIWRLAEDGTPVIAARSGDEDDSLPDPELPASLLSATGPAEPVEMALGDGTVLFARTADRDGGGGIIAITRGVGRPEFQDDETRLLGDIAFQVGIAIAHVAHHAALDRLARIDGLTGLLVRRAFIDAVEARFERRGALLYVDLDNFKPVNDTHGHEAGDRVLCLVAEQLSVLAGKSGLAARLGGDEFAVWLDEAGEDAAEAAGRALQDGAGHLAEFAADAARPLGYSLGIAVHDPTHEETLEALVARADAAMYAVKRDGKGGLRLAPPPAAALPGEGTA